MAADGVAPDDLLLRAAAPFPVTAAQNSGAPRTPALLTREFMTPAVLASPLLTPASPVAAPPTPAPRTLT